MNILLLGGGGREHAIAWKLKQSPKLRQLYIAPGNAGTAALGNNVTLTDTSFETIKTFVQEKEIDMVVVGPEAPLVEGLGDKFSEDASLQDVLFFGPGKAGAMLEGSKDHAKAFMQRHNIPTARSATFSRETLNEGLQYLEDNKGPFVLKADGLAAGKGVLIIEDLTEAKKALTDMLEGEKFGEASRKVVIEEFLSGIELSVFVITDGKDYVLLPEAKDYKRIGEGDTGLNTGGMGSISPVSFANEVFMEKVEARVIKPTVKALEEEETPYCGFIFFGLINVNNSPYVIEYNVRMGDPEAESVIPRIKSDLLELMVAAASKKLGKAQLEIDPRHAAAVMMVSGGYPEKYEKGKEIQGLDETSDCLVFHAGTVSKEGKVVTSGGRVLAVTSLKPTMREALNNAYANSKKVRFDKSYYRKDLGFDLEKYNR